MFSKAKNIVPHFSSIILVTIMELTFGGYPIRSYKLPNNRTHLVVASTRSPLVKDQELAIINFGILEYILLEILADRLSFTYEILPPSDVMSSGYILPNGSWTGAAGLLERREVDFSIGTTALTVAKARIMDLSYPVLYDDASIIIPFPRENSRWVYTSAFHNEVWIVLGIFFLLMIFAAWAIHRITNIEPDQSQDSLIYWMFYFLSLWANQGVTVRNPSTPFRTVVVFSAFGIYIISNYFTAAYTSELSIPVFKTAVDSIEDLANSDTVKSLVPKGSGVDEYLLASSDPVVKKIGDQLRRYPERRILNAFTVEDISSIVKDDCALLMGTLNAQSMIEESYKINKKCRVTLVDKSFYSRTLGITFPKDSPLTKSIDRELLLLHENGLIQFAMKRSVSHNRCSVTEIQKSFQTGKPAPLKLSNVIGWFFILAIGLALGFIVFLAELAIIRFSQTTQRYRNRVITL